MGNGVAGRVHLCRGAFPPYARISPKPQNANRYSTLRDHLASSEKPRPSVRLGKIGNLERGLTHVLHRVDYTFCQLAVTLGQRTIDDERYTISFAVDKRGPHNRPVLNVLHDGAFEWSRW